MGTVYLAPQSTTES